MRVTLVRGRLRLVGDSSSSSSVSDRVRGSSVGPDGSGVEDPDVSDGDVPVVPDTSVGNPNSVVTGGLVRVMVGVVVAVEVPDEAGANVGSTNSIGASCGLSALLVSATTPQTTSAITVSAATLAPSTAGVE
ncbi:hypothetical protein AFM11_23445 [Mycolicibacterium wolinskyi]|uniref:Uncharacterized protein n=1 Tax=Mycolicibacterium wolinskyi TaxID=59750 RepID=A0A132PHH4_9MYCO|nr:hypothetical protein [Mycolicibacterium wolinskyi]KWX21808.1 hypothetical protein AFM11_23445 [Mycolicibacterium wolinskyi]